MAYIHLIKKMEYNQVPVYVKAWDTYVAFPGFLENESLIRSSDDKLLSILSQVREKLKI